ncbi:MAG: polyhydroxyalkanoate synthesis repressor PhaR [Gammaproteobacteria bacterium]|nr:polyhydroxyalkanoate synthesis repressor PhaR [Gammaproteobacteria bacterium]
MSDQRIIKKYPNRRLYDTAISSYITLGDVRRLVTEGVQFQVIDVRSKEDITRSILLQIITEQEESGQPIFTSDALTNIIRAYGKNVESVMGDFIERSLEVFTEQQQAMTKQMQRLMGGDPVAAMTDMTKHNLELWTTLQHELLKGVQPPAPDGNDEDDRKA